MKNTIGSVAWNIGIRKATIRHFCKNFNVDLKKQIFKSEQSEIYLKADFIDYLLKNKDFLINYQKDYYQDKTIEKISETINQHKKAIELYLKYYHPKYFIKGKFMPKKNYSLRYISSYHIDFVLGGNYEI